MRTTGLESDVPGYELVEAMHAEEYKQKAIIDGGQPAINQFHVAIRPPVGVSVPYGARTICIVSPSGTTNEQEKIQSEILWNQQDIKIKIK